MRKLRPMVHKRLDAHLLRSSHCKSMAGRRDVASNGSPQPEPSAAPPLPTSPSPSLAPPPEVRKVLLLPRAEEDWKKANKHFAITLMPLVMNETDVDTMNKMICDEVYEYFASRYGTKTPRDPRVLRAKKHPRHNRELKRLRKVKTSAMRELRLAQREESG